VAGKLVDTEGITFTDESPIGRAGGTDALYCQ